MSRRLRLIWHKLWLIPLVGATADVVASEAAKLGATVPIPWLFSAIGVAGMLAAAVVRAYSVPLIPEGLETPDEALTRRSRVLGERLGATPVRVFVADLPKLRGKVDTYLDGHDLFVSERVAELPEAERDFVLARALPIAGPLERFLRRKHGFALFCLVLWLFAGYAAMIGLMDWNAELMTIALIILTVMPWPLDFLFPYLEKRRFGPPEHRTSNILSLKATGNLSAAVDALEALADTDGENKQAALDAGALEKWWNAGGKKTVEASEWYQRELARASSTVHASSRAISGDSSIELPASGTN